MLAPCILDKKDKALVKNRRNIGIDHLLILKFNKAIKKLANKNRSEIDKFATTSKFRNLENGKVKINPAIIFL